jgi:hypothetical protein
VTRRRPVARKGPEGPLLTFAEAVELAGYRRARLFAGRRFAVLLAAALRRRRLTGFAAAALRRRRFTGLAAPAALRRRRRLTGFAAPAALRRRRFAGAFFAVALRRRRFAGAFFAAALRRRRLTGLPAAALRRRRAGFRAVDLRAVRRRVVVRRFAGFRAVFLADFRAVRLFAGGTVTTFRREYVGRDDRQLAVGRLYLFTADLKPAPAENFTPLDAAI